MKNIALIVAGGEGTRMGSSLPKQFLKVQERPLMMLTLEAFMLSNTPSLIYLIMHGDHMDRWADECRQWNFKVPHNLVPGGKTRTESVYLGLKALEKAYGQDHYPDWIAVHDAVRPLLSPDLIDRGFTMAKLRGNSIPSIPLKDSIRKIENEKSLAVDRNQFRLIQTPQIFPGL
jgi:2-C-methyl-D-erythritol 4-phosphate cytidylyltransferase